MQYVTWDLVLSHYVSADVVLLDIVQSPLVYSSLSGKQSQAHGHAKMSSVRRKQNISLFL